MRRDLQGDQAPKHVTGEVAGVFAGLPVTDSDLAEAIEMEALEITDYAVYQHQPEVNLVYRRAVRAEAARVQERKQQEQLARIQATRR